MARERNLTPVIVVAVCASAVATYLGDRYLLPDHSPGFAYGAVVLLTFWLPWRRSPALVAAALSPVVLAGSWEQLVGDQLLVARVNVGISLVVLWIAALVAWWQGRAADRRNADIREHSEALSASNEALRGREAYLRQLIDVANAVIVATDVRGRVIEWNRQAELVYGVSREEAMALDVYESLVSPENLAASRDEFRRLMEGGTPNRSFEQRICRPDGEERVLLWSTIALRDSDGAVVGALGSGMDITNFERVDRERDERLRFEELIADFSARLADPSDADRDQTIRDGLRGLGEFMGADRVATCNLDEGGGRLIAGHLWSCPALEGPNDPFPDRQAALDRAPWLAEKLRRGEDFVIASEQDLPSKTGFEEQVRERVGAGSAVFVPMMVGGRVVGSLSLLFAVGERSRDWPEVLVKRLRLVAGILGGDIVRRRTEEQLRLVTAETRAILDTAVDGIVTVLPDGTIETFSPSAERIFGYSADEIVGQNISILWTAEERARFEAEHGTGVAVANVTLGPRGEVVRQHKDGTRIPMHLSIGEIQVGGKRLYTGFLRDLSEEKTMEQRLRSAASEAALAEQRERKMLASDLHDGLGQLLSLASMKLGALRSKVELPELRSLAREVEEVIGEADRRTTSLTYQLSPPVLDDVGLVAAAEWLVEDLQRRYSLRVDLSHDAHLVSLEEAGRVTLFRALRELLINVAKHAEADEARVHISSRDGLVRVSVEDRGRGFDPAEEIRGFGLLSLRDRLEHLGGELSIESPPGGGTRVTAAVPEFKPAPSAPH